MVPRLFRSRPDPVGWEEVVAALRAAAERFASTRFEIRQPVIRWTDGPGPEQLMDAAGDLPGWSLVAGPPGDIEPVGPALYLDRTLSDRALAVCLTRFYASQGRHWTSGEAPRFQEAWRALTGVNDPGESAFPIPTAIARLLLEAPDPPGLATGPTRADTLSAKLAALGYERLWSVAFLEIS